MALSRSQFNVAANKARHLVFFESARLVFNYKTGQWSRIPAYGFPMFSINSKTASIGLLRDDSGTVEAYEQGETEGNTAQQATFETGSFEVNQNGRAVVQGVRPLVRGGRTQVQVAAKSDISDIDEWTETQRPTGRTNMANFRKEGRYLKVRLIADDFTTAIAFDVDIRSQGRA